MKRHNRRVRQISQLIAGSLLIAGLCCGAPITFTTPAGASTAGGPVSASAIFTPANAGIYGNMGLYLTVANTLANPTDANQLVSSVQFAITNLGNTTPSSNVIEMLGVSSGYIGVNSNGSQSILAANVAWIPIARPGGYTVCSVCPTGTPLAPGPSKMIIGPSGANGLYSNADSSIAGNTANFAYIDNSAVFYFSDLLTSNISISNVVFGFGTGYGADEIALTSGGANSSGSSGSGPTTTTPEPMSLLLSMIGMCVIAVFCRRRKYVGDTRMNSRSER